VTHCKIHVDAADALYNMTKVPIGPNVQQWRRSVSHIGGIGGGASTPATPLAYVAVVKVLRQG